MLVPAACWAGLRAQTSKLGVASARRFANDDVLLGSIVKTFTAAQNALAKFNADTVCEMSRGTVSLIALRFGVGPAKRYITCGLPRSLPPYFVDIALKWLASLEAQRFEMLFMFLTCVDGSCCVFIRCDLVSFSSVLLFMFTSQRWKQHTMFLCVGFRAVCNFMICKCSSVTCTLV